MVNEKKQHPRGWVLINMDSQEAILVRVGGVLFAMDQETIHRFGSRVLTLLLDLQSSFQQPHDGIYKVDEADAESFSVFLHLARFRTLPCSLHGTATIYREADFWDIQSKVEAAFRRSEEESLLFCKALGWGLLPDSSDIKQQEDKIQCTECGRKDTMVCPYCRRSLKHKSELVCEWCEFVYGLPIFLFVVFLIVCLCIAKALVPILALRAWGTAEDWLDAALIEIDRIERQQK